MIILVSVNDHKFQKIGHSDLILSVHVGKEETHKYMQYEVSITIYIGNQRKLPK